MLSHTLCIRRDARSRLPLLSDALKLATDNDDAYRETKGSPSALDPGPRGQNVSAKSADDSFPHGFHNRNYDEWLERGTLDLLDEDVYPVGTLTEDDVETLASLMNAWARRGSVDAALTVERLLKRVVDDVRARNPAVYVTTRLYTHVSKCAVFDTKRSICLNGLFSRQLSFAYLRFRRLVDQAIDAWAKSGAEGSSLRAQSIHDAMVRMHAETADPRIGPSVVSYNALLNSWSRSDDRDAAKMADRILMQMVDAFRGGNDSLKPDAVTFSTVIRAYGKLHRKALGPAAVKRSEELFELMEELGVVRNAYVYSALQNVYARSGESDAPERTKRILDRMLELYANGDALAKPNTFNFNDVLNAYSRTPSKRNAERATELLGKMERSVDDGGCDVQPDRLSYAVTILACARCADGTVAARSAESVLEKLEARALVEAQKRKEVSSAAPPAVTLDLECFNVVLTAISRSRQPDAPERALKIIERMEQHADDGEECVRPNIRSWNALLNTIAKARGKETNWALVAEQVLERVSKCYREGHRSAQPNAYTFAAVLNAYQRSSDPNAAQRADEIVREMEKLYDAGSSQTSPDVFHYTIVCNAWANSGSRLAPDRCLQIMGHMFARDQAGYPNVKPNSRTYNAVLECLSRSGEVDRAEELLYHMLSRFQKGDDRAMPDAFSFNSVIRALTSPKCKARGSGKRAEAILDRFLEFQEENPSVKPDARSFKQIISHWYSRSNNELDAPYRAEYILNRMVSLFKSGHKHLAPSLFSIKTVMESYARAKHRDAGRNAERLLKLIRDLDKKYDTPDMAVTTAVMNSVLLAWANSGDENAGSRAESHLDAMETNYSSGRTALKPNAKSYGYVISAWSKSNSPEKARRAFSVLRRMEVQQAEGNELVKVDAHAYSLAINACAFQNSDVDAESNAFQIAVSLFDRMLESTELSPSSLTFGWFIQACGRLRVDNCARDSAIEKAFTACCEKGLVNDFVLQRLKGASTDALFATLVSPGRKNCRVKKRRVSIDLLPSAWKRNCQLKRGN